MEFSGDLPMYLRPIDRQLQRDFNENNTRCGVEDTYGHTRGFRSNERTATKEGEMILIEHPQGIIGIVKEGLIAPLAKKWSMDRGGI